MADTTKWKIGFKKAAAWGTAVAVGAGDGVLLVSESMSEGIPEEIPDEAIGQAMSGQAMQGNVKTEGNFVETVRFEGFEKRLALFCGGDSVSAVGESTVAHRHAMPFAPSNEGLFGTLVVDKAVGSAVYEYPGVKLNQLELAHDKGRLQATFSGIANRCERASVLNTGTTMQALTYPTSGLVAIFNQLKVKLHQLTGAESNLLDADEVLVSSAKMTLSRNLAGDYVCGSNSGEINEPTTNGFPTGSIELTFPKHTPDVDALIKLAQTRQVGSVAPAFKASLVWSGPICDAAIPFELEVLIANMTISKAPANAGSPGAKVPVTMTFAIHAPVTDALGTDWAWAKAAGAPVQFAVTNKNASAAA